MALIARTNAGTAYWITADGPLSTEPATRWRAYGVGDGAAVIRLRTEAQLPFQAVIKVEAL